MCEDMIRVHGWEITICCGGISLCLETFDFFLRINADSPLGKNNNNATEKKRVGYEMRLSEWVGEE
jgi:hypothetical protein